MYLKAVFKVAKIAALTLLPLLVFIFLAGNIFAHEGEVDPYEDIEEAAFAPDSPFYFLKGWQEAIEGVIANFQGDEARANLELRFAERRVAEMKRLARLGEDGELMENIKREYNNLPMIYLPSLESESTDECGKRKISEPLKISELAVILDEVLGQK